MEESQHRINPGNRLDQASPKHRPAWQSARITNSPAYILPNSRIPCEMVLEENSTRFRIKLNGASQIPKWRSKQLMNPAAQPFNFDIEQETGKQHTN